jgi:sulfite reductase alpha subunit-like flavoprotein
MEFDISGSGFDYETGDHVAVWPMNSEQDVERLLKILGLWEKRDTVISVESIDRKYEHNYNLFFKVIIIVFMIFILTKKKKNIFFFFSISN